MPWILNGRSVELPFNRADDRLLWVLRDDFELNGPKYGCGVGSCGACLAHVDGEAQTSCTLAVADVDRRSVTTLEGLGHGYPDGLHPVQQAFIAAQVPQCGFCQNGQIMMAAALLASRSQITPDAIAAAMDRIVCRCGTYARIAAALAAAATGGSGR
jgi:aerobic-type carbon monoxide dehydrogenase small subunit (CoxS/CutS family)